MYNLLEGDDNKYEKMNQAKKIRNNSNRIIEGNEFEINTSSNKNNFINNNIIEDDEDEDEIFNQEEEKEDDEENIF